jgi:O-antigen/teichoic acid export membrane protein
VSGTRVRDGETHRRTVLLLVANSLSLIGTQAVTSLLGAAYWWFAARQFAPAAVGVASAAVSAMLLLGSVGNLGLGTLLMGELPRMSRDRASLIVASLALTTAVAVMLGLAACAVAPYLSKELGALRDDPLSVILFSVGVAGTATGMVLDQALIGLFRGRVQLWRNTIFSIVKLLALVAAAFLVSRHDPVAIYATWTVGAVASIIIITPRNLLNVRARTSGYAPHWHRLRGLQRSAFAHFAFNLPLQIPSFFLPLLAVTLLSATENASFYIAWQVAFLLFVVPIALTSVLYSVIVDEPTALARTTRLTLVVSASIMVVGGLALWVGATSIIRVFGAAYVAGGALTLQILMLAAIPMTIKSHYVAIYRIGGALVKALPLVWVTTALELVAAAAGALVFGNLRGLTGAWVAMLTLESLAMIAPVWKALRTRDARALALGTFG